MIKKLMMILLMIVNFVIFTGCVSSKETGANENLDKHDPVTVTVGTQFLTEEEFARYITEPVKKKYP